MIICRGRSSRKNILISGIASGLTVVIILVLFGSFLNIFYGKKRKHDRFSRNFPRNSVFQRLQLPALGEYAQYQDIMTKLSDEAANQNFRRFEENFSFSKCKKGFKIFVYPSDFGEEYIISPNYRAILDTFISSHHITDKPDEACLFITSIDTLDRDILSKKYVKNANKKFERLIHWNGGENHLIFVFFSGKWPHYRENSLSFNFGKAMLVKASASLEKTRINYDVSIPLISQEIFSKRILAGSNKHGDDILKMQTNVFPIRRKYLLSFKGKRYLYGIGTKTRNVLRLISNFEDIVLLTTCRHGKNWQQYKDQNCDADNKNFDQYDYDELLSNSTFCLVPRGRRLGSFRFIEVLKYGCIPVLLSNGWDLPFSEVLDWSKFSINIDERLVLRIPFILRGISDETILSMKQQVLFVWESYFSSTKKIVHTVLQIIKCRIYPNKKHGYLLWNTFPGALKVSADFSPSLTRYPFYTKVLGTDLSNKFTAVILAVTPVYKTSAPLFKLIKIINTSTYVDQILVVWLCSVNIPIKSKWPQTNVPLRVIHPSTKSTNERYVDMDLIKTDAVFSFDEDVILPASTQLDFAFSVWKSNPSRLVGFNTANHVFDETTKSWKYSSKIQNDFSIVSMTSAVFHRYYCHHYKTLSPKGVLALVDREKSCESLAMNFLVSSITNYPPIKVTNEKKFYDGDHTKPRLEKSFTNDEYMLTQQKCFDELTRIYSGIPLVHSKVSTNPILYKDIVSISRKKYKSLG